MSAKKWLFAIVMIGFLSQSFLWTAQYKMETLFEKGFDAEIEDVIFDSYEEDGAVRFYPKIVILKHLDKALSQGDWKYYKKEVNLFNTKGVAVKTLWFPYGSRVGCSRNGEYFYVWSVVKEKPEPYHPRKLYDAKIEESSFVVYNDKGEMLWKKSPYEPAYETDYMFFISPKDGSIIEVGMTMYDAQGNEKPIRAKDLYGYDWYGLYGFTQNWEYAVVISRKSPNKQNQEPVILLVDSLLNRVWERTLDEHLWSNNAAISNTGAYIYASGYTMALYRGLQSETGYLYNKKGDLVMKIPNGYIAMAFSPHEKYILVKSLTPTGNGPKKGIILIDIEAKKILFEKEWKCSGAAIAPDGKIALIEVIRPPVDQNEIDKMTVAEGRAYMKSLYKQSLGAISIFDTKGNILFGSDSYELLGDKLTLKILDWDGTNLIFGITDRTQNKANIILIKFKGE